MIWFLSSIAVGFVIEHLVRPTMRSLYHLGRGTSLGLVVVAAMSFLGCATPTPTPTPIPTPAPPPTGVAFDCLGWDPPNPRRRPSEQPISYYWLCAPKHFDHTMRPRAEIGEHLGEEVDVDSQVFGNGRFDLNDDGRVDLRDWAINARDH